MPVTGHSTPYLQASVPPLGADCFSEGEGRGGRFRIAKNDDRLTKESCEVGALPGLWRLAEKIAEEERDLAAVGGEGGKAGRRRGEGVGTGRRGKREREKSAHASGGERR